MSSMSLPRVFFHGKASANVPTGNNGGPLVLLDVPTCSLNPTPLKTDAAMRAWLMSLTPTGKKKDKQISGEGDDPISGEEDEDMDESDIDEEEDEEEDLGPRKKRSRAEGFILDEAGM